MAMQRVHFIGIGGIGMSALARYFLSQEWKVSGSDMARSPITDALKNEGMRISIGHTAKNVAKGIDLVIHSAAIKEGNPELDAARALGLRVQYYADAVGELTRQFTTIAVSGSHGKSTTTSLIGLALMRAKLDPTIIVGTNLRELGGTNFRNGGSEFLVLEADEYNRAFHRYHPEIAVLLNIDKEHLDIYGNLAGVIKGFKEYVNNIHPEGYLVINDDDPHLRKIAEAEERRGRINVVRFSMPKTKRKLGIFGAHNQSNAEAVWQVAKILGIAKKDVDAVFASYRGAWRRMELLQSRRGVEIYSDYAHHPTEIAATLRAFKEAYPKKPLVCIFEPHQAARLNSLFKEFAASFSAADVVAILPTYKVAGRDEAGKYDAADLARAIAKQKKEETYFIPEWSDVETMVRGIEKEGSAVIVFMGAGGIDARARKFLEK